MGWKLPPFSSFEFFHYTGGKNNLAPSPPPASTPPATAPAGAPSLLTTIIAGRQLRRNLDKNAQVLYVGFNAAGGSYRVLHNCWVEVFYRTPKPAFNGGSVVSYILFNPADSTVSKARTLRFVYNYSKLGGPKLTSSNNFFYAKNLKSAEKENKKNRTAQVGDGWGDLNPKATGTTQ